jgi:hypothetical protein
MPADYQTIREENIARYGWDTAVLDLLGQLYSERTHFIFELIQNAEDAGATELAFELFDDRLEVRHDGRPFTEADVRGVCGVGKSEKAADFTKIGKFGIGFKSVYAYTKSPRIYSNGESFRIESYVRPFAVEPVPEPATLFVFPFDHDEVPAVLAVREISAALTAIEPATLLFLTSIRTLRVRGGAPLSRRADGTRITVSKGRRNEEWLAWQRPVAEFPGYRVEVAFRVDPVTGQLGACAASPLSVFLPTEKETFLGFLVQGPYRTTPARDNVAEHDPSNQALVRATATLLIDVLLELRDDGLLTADVLAALPVDAARFQPGSMFRPLYDAVREALATQQLIPVTPYVQRGVIGGGCRAANEVKLAGDPELCDLLNPEQLVAGNLTPSLRKYLREEIGIGEVTVEDVVANASADFLTAQSDEWIARFYGLLVRYPELWRDGIARTAPIIRLEDGSQVAPFDAEDRPAVYLPRPGSGRSGFPVVRRAIAESAAARPFLSALGFATPDVADEVLLVVIPKYKDLAVADLEVAQREADLDLIVRALDEKPRLAEQLRDAVFLVGENAATGEQRFMPPAGLYQRSKELEDYFDGNSEAWFAGDVYGPWLVQLRAMGVRDDVAVRARAPGPFGHVVIADEFARHERGLDGFDPDAEIDGLEFALRHPSHARSEFVWNILLAPSRRLVAGLVEKSVRDEFVDSTRENTGSAIAAAARRSVWLPGPDGTFRRPGDLSLDDLPPTFARDDTLAQALGMARPVVAEAARQLGVPPAVLWGLSGRPDLVALIEHELKRGAGA